MQYDVTPHKFSPAEWRSSEITNKWCCYKELYPQTKKFKSMKPKDYFGIMGKIFLNEITAHEAKYPDMEFDYVMQHKEKPGRIMAYFIIFKPKTKTDNHEKSN